MANSREQRAEPNLDFEANLARASVEVSREDDVLTAASGDFGRIARGSPVGVIRVRDEQDLLTVLQLANSCGAQLTLRSGGNSQSGQALASESYCVSLGGLKKFVQLRPESSTAVCSASSSWRAVVDMAAAHGMVPKVVPLNLDLSIGGTLSAGGFGASSHRFGSASSNVVALTAITGAGRRITCSRQSESVVFDAALAGLGRTAVITSATISLRPARRSVSTVFAVYTNLGDCLGDMRFLRAQDACSYIEGFCSTCFQGLKKTNSGRQPLFRWFYCLQFSIEHEEPEAAVQAIIEQLHCLEVNHRESDDHQLFLDRYQARFATMRSTGAWEQAHPWFECLLPSIGAEAFIEEILSLLPVSLGDGHRLFEIDGANNPRCLQLPVDSSNMSLAFAILPAGVPEASLATAREFVERATELLHRHGGRRYMSGWLGACDEGFWRRHHGERYGAWMAAKRELDPNTILTSELFSR